MFDPSEAGLDDEVFDIPQKLKSPVRYSMSIHNVKFAYPYRTDHLMHAVSRTASFAASLHACIANNDTQLPDQTECNVRA